MSLSDAPVLPVSGAGIDSAAVIPSFAAPSFSIIDPLTHDAKGRAVNSDIVQRSYDTFVRLDTNRSGSITAKELKSAINSFTDRVNVNAEQTAQIIRLASHSDSEKQRLTFSEFFNVYSALNILSQLHSSDLHRLHSSDVTRALRDAGLSPTKPQLQRMLTMVDKYRTYDRMGRINFLEFLSAYIESPMSPQQTFLHSWYSAGRNATPYNRPANIDPVHDFVAGTAAGIALTIVGHPFDTIKVRLQTTPAPSAAAAAASAFTGGLDCLRQTLRLEGPMALYKGMSSPLSTIPLVNAITFWAYGQSKELLHQLQGAEHLSALNIQQIALCGGFSGLISCLISCPVELIKTRLQIQYSGVADVVQPTVTRATAATTTATATTAATAAAATGVNSTSTSNAARSIMNNTAAASRLHAHTHTHIGYSSICAPHSTHAYTPFTGVVDCISRSYSHGGVAALYRGMAATVYREVPGYSVQFGTYESLKRVLTPAGEKVNDLSPLSLIAAGGVAGVAGWVVSYPMDFIKSQLQAEAYDVKVSAYKKNPWLLDGGFFDCLRGVVREQGVRAVWRGFTTCAVRAMPANAAGFYAYEGVLKVMRGAEE